MEASRNNSDGFRSLVQSAIDDLRDVGDEASEEVRTRIDSAVAQLREAAGTVGAQVRGSAQELQTQAEDSTDEVLERMDALRRWIRGASADLVDEIQAEIDRRRSQLGISASRPNRPQD